MLPQCHHTIIIYKYILLNVERSLYMCKFVYFCVWVVPPDIYSLWLYHQTYINSLWYNANLCHICML